MQIEHIERVPKPEPTYHSIVINSLQENKPIILMSCSEDDIDTLNYYTEKPDEVEELILPPGFNHEEDSLLAFGHVHDMNEGFATTIIPKVGVNGTKNVYICYMSIKNCSCQNANSIHFHYAAHSSIKCALEIIKFPKHIMVFRKGGRK